VDFGFYSELGFLVQAVGSDIEVCFSTVLIQEKRQKSEKGDVVDYVELFFPYFLAIEAGGRAEFRPSRNFFLDFRDFFR